MLVAGAKRKDGCAPGGLSTPVLCLKDLVPGHLTSRSPHFIHFPCLFPSHTFLSLSTVLHIVPITKCSCDATDHYYVFFSPSTLMFYTFLPKKTKKKKKTGTSPPFLIFFFWGGSYKTLKLKKIWNRPGCSSPLPALHPEDRADRDLPHLDGVPSAS